MDLGASGDMGVTLENARVAETEPLWHFLRAGGKHRVTFSTALLGCAVVGRSSWLLHTHPTFIHHTLLSGRSVPCPRLAAG